MVEKGKLRPDCVNASNPYHECGSYCLKKSAKNQARNIISDDHGGIRDRARGKKTVEERKMRHPDCTKASNPYHECDENCLKRIFQDSHQGDKMETGPFALDISKKYGQRKKGSPPKLPQELDNVSISSTSLAYPQRKADPENGNFINPPHLHSEEKHIVDPLPNREQIESSLSNEKQEKTEDKSLETHNLLVDDNVEIISASSSRSNLSFSFIANALVDTDNSAMSETYITVGNYRIKAKFSSILKLIFDIYGDIASTCQLESSVIRSYYLECVCFVVQELQSSKFSDMTKSKAKELLAIVKDVESSQVKVGWLRGILDEIAETMEQNGQNPSLVAVKSNYDHNLESMKVKLESVMNDLAMKQREVDETKARVAEMRAELSELLELKSSQLNEFILFINKKGSPEIIKEEHL